MKYRHGHTRRPRQHHRPWLGHVSRTALTIDRESDRPTLLELPAHAQQCAHRSPALRSAYLHKAEFPHNAPHPFSIKTVTAHDPYLQVPPQIHRGDDAAVPKRINDGARF